MRNNIKALKFWAIKLKQKIWFNGLKIYTKYTESKRKMAISFFMFQNNTYKQNRLIWTWKAFLSFHN